MSYPPPQKKLLLRGKKSVKISKSMLQKGHSLKCPLMDRARPNSPLGCGVLSSGRSVGNIMAEIMEKSPASPGSSYNLSFLIPDD